MEKEHIKKAIMRQEQTFRQQVHELHRVYRVQKQLMMEMQVVEMNRAQASADTPTKLTVEIDRPQWYSNSGEKKGPFVEDFDLELTLATGGGRRQQEKPSNSDSGASGSLSNSDDSEPGRRFPESNVTIRFQNESQRHDDQLMQSPWLYQCLSLKMA